MISLNDYLYDGNTVLKILLQYSSDLKARDKNRDLSLFLSLQSAQRQSQRQNSKTVTGFVSGSHLTKLPPPRITSRGRFNNDE